jgi:hypothetical protein
MKISRREFVKKTAAMGAGAMFMPILPSIAKAFRTAPKFSDPNPHFLIHVSIFGGMDSTYLFDARPLAMTQANLIQNYIGADPEMWTGTNGQSCWATRLVEPLKRHREYFSVLNGVHMSNNFDGHEENLRMFMSGNPFGAECYIPHLNDAARGLRPLPVDALLTGELDPNFFGTNAGNIIPLSTNSTMALVNLLNNAEMPNSESSVFRFVQSRLNAAAEGQGKFSGAARQMSEGMSASPFLAEQILKLEINNQEGATLLNNLNVLSQCFKNGISRSGMVLLGLDIPLDTHDGGTAKEQPTNIGNIANTYATLFNFLRTTPFDETRSLMDVTTVVIGSEMSRTMRQTYFPIDNTGTDHNPLSNTIIVGGKGIRGGLVLGESDFRTAEEELSGAHLAVDQQKLKLVGKPFDFSTDRVSNERPPIFRSEDYLTVNSVINTVYRAFGLPESFFRKRGNVAGVLAPEIRSLLS